MSCREQVGRLSEDEEGAEECIGNSTRKENRSWVGSGEGVGEEKRQVWVEMGLQGNDWQE